MSRSSPDTFGVKGIVDLNTPELFQGLPGTNSLSSPPTVYKTLIITGGRTQENPQPATEQITRNMFGAM